MFKMVKKLFDAQERADLDTNYEDWKKSAAAAAAVAATETKTGAKAVVRKISG